MSVLAVDDLVVDYGGLRALDRVSVRVDEDSSVGLIGPNGAGKTTLFDCVLGLVTPTRGSVHVLGEDVTSWPVHKRARLGLGRTFQRLELFGSLSVLENMIVAIESGTKGAGLVAEILRRPSSLDVRNRAQGRAEEFLGLVGLTDQVSTRAADLSIGHSRLLELARALAADPKLLMLDEPSSGLNEEESSHLATLLRRIRNDQDLNLLIVEHDMDFVLGLSDVVYVLDFGKLIATGTPAQIQKDPVVRAAYLGEDIDAGAARR